MSRTSAAPAELGPAWLPRAAWLKPLSSPLCYPAALLAVAAGLAHVPVTPDHLVEAPYVGVLFVVLTASCLLLAGLLLLADSAAAWVMSGATCGLAVAAYAATRTVAFPQIADDVGNWLEPLGVLSVGTESAVVVLAWLALRSRSARRR